MGDDGPPVMEKGMVPSRRLFLIPTRLQWVDCSICLGTPHPSGWVRTASRAGAAGAAETASSSSASRAGRRERREKPWQKPADSYGARYEDCSNNGCLSKLLSARPPSIACCIKDAICSNEPFCPKKSVPSALDDGCTVQELRTAVQAMPCPQTERQLPVLPCNPRPSPPDGAVFRTSLDGPRWLDHRSSSQTRERFRVAGVRDTEQERECECESRAPRAPGLPGALVQ